MKFNPDAHKRKSIRLKNYNYSKEWLYFITISIKNKLCLFWEIKNSELMLFDSWKMVGEYWSGLENKYDNIKLHDFIVMPNHFHGIIEIIKQNEKCDCKICRGAPCGYPNNQNDVNSNIQNDVNSNNQNIEKSKTHTIQGTHKGCPYGRNIIWNIIGWFKSITTNRYIENVIKNNWNHFNWKLWQRNFYEHIIRDEKWYFKISDYIKNNSVLWEEDKFYYTEI